MRAKVKLKGNKDGIGKRNSSLQISSVMHKKLGSKRQFYPNWKKMAKAKGDQVRAREKEMKISYFVCIAVQSFTLSISMYILASFTSSKSTHESV